MYIYVSMLYKVKWTLYIASSQIQYWSLAKLVPRAPKCPSNTSAALIRTYVRTYIYVYHTVCPMHV